MFYPFGYQVKPPPSVVAPHQQYHFQPQQVYHVLPQSNTNGPQHSIQSKATQKIRFINEQSGVKNTRESFKVHLPQKIGNDHDNSSQASSVNNSMSRMVQNPSQILQKVDYSNSIFTQTFPFQKKPPSPNRTKPIQQQQIVQKVVDRTYSSVRTSNYIKRSSVAPNQRQEVSASKPISIIAPASKPPAVENPLFRKKQQGKFPPSPRGYQSDRSQEFLLITPANPNIIEENPYQEDDQVQGQGCEIANERKEYDSLDERSRRKSITTFEMISSGEEQEILHIEIKEDEKRLQQMKLAIDRLSSLPREVLQKANIFKVIVNGKKDERELYIDVSHVPQDWKIKQFAHTLNKMYHQQFNQELRNPCICSLVGRVQTKKLDQNIRMFELIDLAVSGSLGQEGLIILEEE